MSRSSTLAHRPVSWRPASVAVAVIGVAATLLFVSWQYSQPTTLADTTLDKLACASYTPSHNGHVLPLPEVRRLVAADLKLLAERFRCVRTYSVSEGLDEVPRIARDLGLTVMLGLWISADAASNDAEIAHGVALANEFAGTVSAIVVGNEVLLRRELSPQQLRALMERVRGSTRVAVTYADVWEFWLRNASLAEVADFVTIHILPYWEDEPIGIEHALDHVRNIYAKVQASFPNKRIFIGETGWPSVGRPRMEATPSLQNEARFIREFVAYAEANEIAYNLIESFDQPWKRIQEGTVGGYWGLYDAESRAKFPLQGPLPEDPNIRAQLIAAVAAAALFVLAGWFFIRSLSLRTVSLLIAFGYTSGWVLLAQWQYLIAANRTWLEWTATSLWCLFGWAFFACSATLLARWMDGAILVPRPASLSDVVSTWGNSARTIEPWSARLGLLRFVVFVSLAYVSLALAYDGRGRDFPVALIALPIFVLFLLEIATSKTALRNRLANEEWLLAAIVLMATLYFAWRETFHNTRAMGWSALCILFVATLIVGHWRTVHPRERAQQQAGAAELKGI